LEPAEKEANTTGHDLVLSSCIIQMNYFTEHLCYDTKQRLQTPEICSMALSRDFEMSIRALLQILACYPIQILKLTLISSSRTQNANGMALSSWKLQERKYKI